MTGGPGPPQTGTLSLTLSVITIPVVQTTARPTRHTEA